MEVDDENSHSLTDLNRRSIAGIRNWFEKRLDNAIQVEEQKRNGNGNGKEGDLFEPYLIYLVQSHSILLILFSFSCFVGKVAPLFVLSF